MRRAFLFLAAGLIASVAFANPCQAGSLVVSGTAATPSNFSIIGGTAGDLEVVYDLGAGAVITSPVTITTSGGMVGSTVVPTNPSSGVYQFAFTFLAQTNSGDFTIKFTESNSPEDFNSVSAHLTDMKGSITSKQITNGAIVTTAVVPEPTSLALLGIGMASFFTYRRLFKRPATV